jgi:two-component system, chemotaxis family, sensor kinase CheA
MSEREMDFRKRLLATFQGEAEERIRSLASGLIELEKATDSGRRAEITELVFREVHSLKGAARAVNLMEIEAVCQAMEDVFAALKRQRIAPALPLLDLLHQATDLLKSYLAPNQGGHAAVDKSHHALLIRQLKESAKTNGAFQGPVLKEAEAPAIPGELSQSPTGLEREDLPEQREMTAGDERHLESAKSALSASKSVSKFVPKSASKLVPDEKPLLAESVRISMTRLESLLLQVEELLSAKLAVSQRAAELREPRTLLATWGKQWAKLHASSRSLHRWLESPDKQNQWDRIKPELTSLLEFLAWNERWVTSLDTRLAAISHSAQHDQRAIGGMVDHLLQDMKQMLMLPFSTLLEVFPSVGRDLARQQGKEVQIVMHGAEIEVDRRILQEIKDPLMHLVRNCIDHGIEMPEVREQQGKARRGTVTLTIAQKESSKVEVLVADDGGGIDRAKVGSVATRLGLISTEAAEKLGKQEMQSLIFQSGFSTSPLITDISGRGLGLAIVQEKVEKLGGVITLETEPGQGTTFRLLLPLTLATLRGLLVRAEGHQVILPILYVERVARIDPGEIQTVQNRETIRYAEQSLSLVRLAQALELPTRPMSHEQPNRHADKLFVAILSTADKRLAFVVDEIVSEQEILVKGLGPQLARVRNIAGATVLGTGQVIPVINVPDLIKSAIKMADSPINLIKQSIIEHSIVEQDATKDKRILVVEDSITARMQLKNILELSGYTVKTAVDGIEALTTLQTEAFDLVVSDVDMPRLNGLDLTARIRSDKNLADLPVVLVTTLGSREDQERGIEVGANAYITKSNFDQNRLLDTIRRLI